MRDKILGFQKDVDKVNRLYDEDEDWYELKHDIWLTNEQRDLAKKKIKQELRKMEAAEDSYAYYDPKTK